MSEGGLTHTGVRLPLGRRALAWNARLVLSRSGFHAFISGHILVLFLVRGLLFPGTGGDDAEQLVFSQTLAWGYDIANPPLYTWLVVASQQVFGVTVLSVAFVKFSLIWLTYVFLYRSARHVLEDDRLAALAALSPLALYYVAWDAVLGYSHSVLLMAMCAATFYAVLRLDAKGSVLSYLALGLALGLGLLSKYPYALFAVSLLVACLADRGLRARLISPWSLLALAAAAAVILPHILWVVDQPDNLFSASKAKFEISEGLGYVAAAATGVLDAAEAVVGFLSPLLILLLIFFWRAFGPVGRNAHPSARYRRLLEVFFASLLAILFAAILVFAATRIRTHYMFILILFPIYFFARVRAVGLKQRSLERFAGVLSLLAVTVVGGLFFKYVADPLRCSKCYLHVPYAEIADRIRERGFEKGTVFAFWHPYDIAGNLRVYFPDSRVITAKHSAFIPPPAREPGQCLLIWTPHPDGWRHRLMVRLANERLGTKLTVDEPVGYVEVEMAMARDRPLRFAYILAQGQGDCR